MREELEKILAKGSLDSADVDKLAKNKAYLTQEELVKLGWATAPVANKVVMEPVAEPKVVVEPVKKTRSKKIIK